MGGETRYFRQSILHSCSGLDAKNANVNEHLFLNNYSHSTRSNMSMPGISDSGSSGHYACMNSQCIHKRPAGENIIIITFPNGEQAKSTHIGLFPN